MLKIKLLKTFNVFAISDDVKSGLNKLRIELNKLAMKINLKIREEFFISVNEVMEQDFPNEIKDFEAYEEHENEHKQLSKILKYLKKFLKTLIIQVVNDKFTLKERSLEKFNVPIFKRRNRHGFQRNKIPSNPLRFICQPIEDNPKINSVLTTVGLKISTFYYDTVNKQEHPFSFINSINESLESDFMNMDIDSNGYNEIIEENISWADHFTINMEINACHPVDIINNILSKAQQTSLYMHMIRIQKQCKIIDPEQNIVKIKIEYIKQETYQENSSSNFKLR